MRLGRKSDCRSRFQWKSNSLKEVNVMNYKILDCDVIKQDGDTVYWTTQSGKNRLWSHMGKIGSKSGSHLNMS